MTDPSISPDNQPTVGDDEISLLDLLIVLAKHKKLILGLPALAAILAAGISLLLPDVYTGSTKILPPQHSESTTAAMLAQLGGLAGLAGGVTGIKSPNDLYVGMLMSRTIADNLIKRFDLNTRYDQKYPSGTRKELAKLTTISPGKDGIIAIDVDDEDPKRAAELANAYVDELFGLTKVLAVTEASQRRLFFERQLDQARENLSKAEIAARQALQKRGLVQVEGQGRAIVEMTATLRGKISAKEVQIGAMRAFATDSNPDLMLAQKELESLKRELARIEGTSEGKSPQVPASDGSGIDSSALLRNVKYHETIYELLAKQYEIAKVDEARESPVVQVMDKAIEPDRRSRPKRTLIVLLSAIVALFVGMFWAFVREGMEKASTDARQSERLKVFKRHLAWR